CLLTFGTFSIDGSIADAVGAEFVNYNVDNDPSDGDGCEFVAGILLDALPPFAGQTVPSTATPLLIGCIDATISASAPCDACLEVEFCNGADGAGSVPIENIVVVDFQSFQDISFIPCCVYVQPVPTFKRGDCNDDDKVDLADAASVLGHQFAGFPINCEDACDANDDGKINLADSVYLLNYLFKFGAPPPNPGPITDGADPTDDTLDCETAAC
ncbi:MAG: dockerin type I repeat-containing protein, partial [Planctomycetota bacterium]